MVKRRQLLGGMATIACWMRARQAVAANGFADLPAVFARIEAQRGGRLGVAVLDTGANHRTGYRKDERFPLGSTFKLLAAGAVLALSMRARTAWIGASTTPERIWSPIPPRPRSTREATA